MTHTYGVSDYTAHYDIIYHKTGKNSTGLVPVVKVAHPHLTGKVIISS